MIKFIKLIVQSMTLYIRPISADLQHDTELFAEMDPYVKVKIDGQRKRTRANKGGGKKPTWNQVLTFKFKQSPHSSKMMIKLYDQERFIDDLIGEAEVPLKKYIENQNQIQQNIQILFKGKPAGFLRASIRFAAASANSTWETGNTGNNSGWGSTQNQSGQKNNSDWSGWGQNNNGWSQEGNNSGW